MKSEEWRVKIEMAKKKVKLSERVRLPEKYRLEGTNWLRDVPEHIKIYRRAEHAARVKTLEELERPPEPGYGLDGYPLQRVKGGE